MQDKIVSFLESIPAGIFFFTGNGEFESVNHAFCQFTGYSKEELAGRWVKEFWFPEDIHGVGADQNQSGNEDLGILEGERAYIHKAGHIVWGDLRVRPLHDKEETPCYVGILTDITEKKEIASRLLVLQQALATQEREFLQRERALQYEIEWLKKRSKTQSSEAEALYTSRKEGQHNKLINSDPGRNTNSI